MSFFTSDVYLTTLAEIYFPGQEWEIGYFETRGQFFRLLSIEGGPPLTSWQFMDSVAPVDDPPEGPVRELAYLPRVILEAEEVTAIPEYTINGPDYFPAPFLRWAHFGDWDEFQKHMAGRRKNLLRDSRAKRKHLQRDFGPLSFVFDDRRPEVFARCVAWKSGQCARTGQPDQFGRPENARFFQCLSDKGALPISSLSAGDRLLAVHCGSLHEDVLYAWIASYDPELGRYSPGRLLLEEVLQECQRRGMREFDFGIGNTWYKWLYATHNRTIGPLGHAPLLHLLGQGLQVNARRVLANHPGLFVAARRVRQTIRSLRSTGAVAG